MTIDLDCGKLIRVLDDMVAAGDAEKLPSEYAVDFYDAEPPMCMEIEFYKGKCQVLSCYELLFSAELDGWYTGEKVTDPEKVAAVLRGLCQ